MTPIFERDVELSRLHAAADAAAKGHGQIIWLAGEAGTGKSRLITEFIVGLPANTIAAVGYCEGGETSSPLGALFDMAPKLGPEFHAAIRAASTSPDSYGDIVGAIRADGPGAVLAFEDAHRANEATLNILKFLGHRITTFEALILISYRSDEVFPHHPLAQLLGDFPSHSTSHLKIDCLSPTGTEAMADFHNARSDGIFARTGGNPFLTLELLRDCGDSAKSTPQAIIWASTTRLSLLEPEQQRWVKLLAHVPGLADRDLVERLGLLFGLQPDLLSRCSGFLRESTDGAYSFRHEIVQASLLAAQTVNEKRHSQQTLLDMLHADHHLAEAHAQLAFHLAMEIGASEKIVGFANMAAQEAIAGGEYNRGVRYLFEALEFAKNLGPEVYGEMVEAWACHASVAENVTEDMLTIVAEANAKLQRLGRPLQIARNHLLLCRLHRYRAERKLAQNHLSAAIGLLEDGEISDELTVAYTLRAQMLLEAGQIKDSIALARQAARLSRTSDSQIFRIDAWSTVAQGLLRQQKSRGIALMMACKAKAARENMHELAARICASNCDETFTVMDRQDSERFIGEWLEPVRQRAPECWKASLEGRVALVRVLQGQMTEGATRARDVLDSDRLNASMRFPALLAAALASSRTRASNATALLCEVEQLAVAVGDCRTKALARLALIEHAFLAGQIDEARSLCDSAAVTDLESAGRDVAHVMQQWCSRVRAPVQNSSVENDNGARVIETDAYSMGNSSEFSARDYPFAAALTKLFVDGPEAHRLINEAFAEFTAIGAHAGLDCARRIAQARNITIERLTHKRGPYRAARAHPLGLTHREVEILRLIVEGSSNREIASQLGRSLRTIEHHVSAILGKMNLDRRVQAALFAISTPGILGP